MCPPWIEDAHAVLPYDSIFFDCDSGAILRLVQDEKKKICYCLIEVGGR